MYDCMNSNNKFLQYCAFQTIKHFSLYFVLLLFFFPRCSESVSNTRSVLHHNYLRHTTKVYTWGWRIPHLNRLSTVTTSIPYLEVHWLQNLTGQRVRGRNGCATVNWKNEVNIMVCLWIWELWRGMCNAGALDSWAMEEQNLKEEAFKHI